MNSKKHTMMKTIIISVFIFLSMLSFAQKKGSISVIIPGVKEAKGSVQLCLYNSEKSFLDEDEIFKRGTYAASVSEKTLTFSDIPAGIYAIVVYWDENSSGRMETNLIGIPKEEVGISQNVSGSFGPPDFEDASFSVSENKITNLVILIKKPTHFK